MRELVHDVVRHEVHPFNMTNLLRSRAMTSTRWIRRTAALAVLGVAAVAAVPPSLPGAPSASAVGENLGSGGEYHTTASTRIFDTRNLGINDPSPGPKPTGSAVHVPVLGKAGVPSDASEVLAVAATVTITQPTVRGYAEVYPKGSRPNPPTSLVNYQAGADVANMVILGVGSDGSITILPQSQEGPGTVHVLVDVFGWVSKSAYVDDAGTGARLIPLASPLRFAEFRPNAVNGGQTVEMNVRGSGGIPNDPSVTAVVVNVTVDNRLPASQNTFVSALAEAPAPNTVPSTSTANVPRGLIKANLAIVPVGADGKIRFYNSAGSSYILGDVFGYLQSGQDATTYRGRIVPLQSPYRALDTRLDINGNIPLGFGSLEDWSFWCLANSVNVGGEPVGKQLALLGNVTGTGFDPLASYLPKDTFLTVYPRGPQPNTSNINVFENLDVPNMAMLTYGNSEPLPDFANVVDPYQVRAYNQNGSLHYLLDVFAVVLDDGDPSVPPVGYCGTA